MTKQEFYEAPKGFVVSDKNNKKWEFLTDPQITPFEMVAKDSEPARIFLSPNGEEVEITFVYDEGIPRMKDENAIKFIDELEVVDS
jgi:hypothetical protein